MRALAVSFASIVALTAPAARAEGPAYRWSRAVDAAAGWVRVELPDDVLAACRDQLPDVRVRAADGSEVPFAVEEALTARPESWPVRDVESLPGRDTTAIIDRGATPPLLGEAAIQVRGDDFLKPVVLEASDDGKDWREFARGSIFATRGVRAMTLRFAPNDRRWWRVRLDDRNGPPVVPESVTGGTVKSELVLHELRVAVRRTASESGTSTYEASLPSANLVVSALQLAPSDVVFARRVRVLDRVFFRDEVTRRAIGGGMISRAPSGESLTIPLGDLHGPAIEIEVDDGASPPLAIDHATALAGGRSLLLEVVASAIPLTLVYGSPTATLPRYDIARALAGGRPAETDVKVARLGDAIDHGILPPVGAPPHGAPIDEAQWTAKRAIVLPPSTPSTAGGVAWIALDGIDASAGLRIVDASSRQVPFVFERAPHRAREAATTTVTHAPGRTTLTIEGLAALAEIDSVELTASAPEYFARGVTAVETTRDARGPTGERVLGSGSWERRPGDPPAPWALSIAAPSQPRIEVRIDDGNDAPLALTGTTVARSVRRIDFVFAPGEALSLLTGNPSAGMPIYDLSLLADAIFAAPATPARLEPAHDIAPANAGVPKWFWAAVIVAGLLVGAALARAMGTKDSS